MSHDHDPQEPRQAFTEEEAAFLRFVRFGELPPRILPTDLAETVETEPPWSTIDLPRHPGPETGHVG
jgi:hypothetical protein